MSWSRQLWRSIEPVFGAILEHPFLRGLTDGSLPSKAFAFYVVQDAHYLREYARALAVVGAKAPAEADIAMFAQHAAGAIAVERSLHEGLLSEVGISPARAAATPVAPQTLAYTSYLLATAYGGSFAEGVGAVLPCYWIYAEVGTHLLKRGSPEPAYQRWIDTYGGEEFADVVQAVLATTDRLGRDLGSQERARAGAHFVTTSRYEWLFWDAAWRMERWPAAITSPAVRVDG